ncbi:MAG TPA: polysaccharide deacetylase family protein [Anaerolineales bacterium]|nr:polysaccharide deacetylase family protein [Anaerolineales bacterium]
MRKIACITLDTEADFLDPTGRIRLFEERALFNRYVNILKDHNVKVTAFLVTSLISKYGGSYQRLQEQIPVEFAIHSHLHDLQNPCSPADIEESVRAFRSFTGKDPSGYRAPVGRITRQGLQTLLDLGLRYDSSIYPSFRPGRLGYNNLHLPLEPFRVRHEAQSIIEIPFAALHGVRLVFSLSYVKLFGWPAYDWLMRVFPLPEQMAVLAHPYDYYFHLLADQVTAGEKQLLLRNARNAFDLFEKMIIFLRAAGYEFELMSGLCDYLESEPLAVYEMDRVIR